MHPVVFQAREVKVIKVSVFNAHAFRNTKDSVILYHFVRIHLLHACVPSLKYIRPNFGDSFSLVRQLNDSLCRMYLCVRRLVDWYANNLFEILMCLMQEQLHKFRLISLSLGFCVKRTNTLFSLSVKSM